MIIGSQENDGGEGRTKKGGKMKTGERRGRHHFKSLQPHKGNQNEGQTDQITQTDKQQDIC